MANCGRCHAPNDEDALQCANCGEILKQVRSGSNYAAAVRESAARNSAQAAEVASPSIAVFQARSVFGAVKLCAWLAVAAGIVATCLASAALLYPDYGYNLMEAGVVIGCAAASIVAVGCCVMAFGYAMQGMSSMAARTKTGVQEEELVSPPRRVPQFLAKYVGVRESELEKQVTRHAGPEWSYRFASAYGNLAVPVTSCCALLCFAFLPQYRLGESYSGYRCVQVIIEGLMDLQREFANVESLVALAIPVMLVVQFVLALRRAKAALLISSLVSFGLVLALFLVNFAKHSDVASQTMLKQAHALIGFRYGYLLTLLLVIACAVAAALRFVGDIELQRVARGADG